MAKKTHKNNPDNKDMITEIKEEFKRHTGVLMEQMRKEVQTVAEGHSGIMRKLDEHDERFDKIESEVGSVKSELQYVKAAVMDTNQTVKAIEKKLDDHETRLSKVEEKVHA
jgi:septal ring factor EnvC (AmiA/AmiB activator)